MKKLFSINLLIAIGLSGCSSDSGTETEIRQPVAINNLVFSPERPKTFTFSWDDVTEATHYKLMEDPDGNSGFSQVGSDITPNTETVNHVVPIYARVNAEYILQSCNTAGCTDSETRSISDFISRGGALGQFAGGFEASNGDSSDSFGSSVSISADGSTMAIGAIMESSNATGVNGDEGNNDILNRGAAYIFIRNGSNWEQQAYLKSSDVLANTFFGQSLSLSDNGDTLAVGSFDNDKVTVFSRSGASWAEQQVITASNGAIDDSFGIAVSLSADGNTLAVGSPTEDSADRLTPNDNGLPNSGAAYVFIRSGSNWTQAAYIKPDDPQDGAFLGASVSLSADGSTLALGAFLYDEIGNPVNIDNTGAVYVFLRNATDQWSQQDKLLMDNPAINDNLGASVSLSSNGNLLAAGAPGETNGAGAAYVFARNSGSWTQVTSLSSTFQDDGDSFGSSVSLSSDGNTLAVGAPREDNNSTSLNRNRDNNASTDSGAVFVYHQQSNWAEISYIKSNDSSEEDLFGGSVDLATDGTLAIGARGENTRTGKAYLY